MKLSKPIIIYLVLILYTVAPIICVLIASGLAAAFGCRVDESGKQPCMAWGRDIGGLLVNLFVSGWFMLVTFPTGGLALVIYTIVLAGLKSKKP